MSKDIIGAIKPIAELLLKALSLIDPKTRDWVRKRKALEFAEKYILTNEALRILQDKTKLSKKELREKARLLRKLRLYRKWFFAYD